MAKKRADGELPAGVLERAIVLLCSELGESVAGERLREELELTPVVAGKALELARAAVVRAAAFDREREVGRAYYRLVHLYHLADAADEYRVALAAQKELNALLGLYATVGEGSGRAAETDGEAMPGRLEMAIRGYLLPLKLAGDDVPLVEHVRIAAARLMDLEAERRAV